MITLKLILFAPFIALWVVLAEAADNTAVTLAAFGTLVTAIIGGIVLLITTKSKTRIEEMKAAAELERVRQQGKEEVLKVQMEAQKAASLANAGSIAALHSSMAVNTAETIKSTVAADQTKQRMEQLEQKLPVVSKSEVEIPPEDPVNTKPSGT